MTLYKLNQVLIKIYAYSNKYYQLIYCSFLLSLVFSSCTQEKQSSIVIINPSSLDLTDKPVTIDRVSLKVVPLALKYPLIRNADGDTIPVQLEDTDQDKEWDELFFVIDVAAGDTLTLSMVWVDTEPDYEKRTSIRFGKRDSKDLPVSQRTIDTLHADQIYGRLGYQSYQTDGPSWENDKVGFRHYFDGRNAKDLFGKRIPAISPENVGISEVGAVEDNYHEMKAWGRDILPVGSSAGLGGIGLMAEDSIMRLGCLSPDTLTNVEMSIFSILTEGPVHSSFTLNYLNWRPMSGKRLEVKENIQIWPGMYAYQNTVEISGISDESLVVGLVNTVTEHPLTELNIGEDWTILFTHDKQGYNGEWWIGLALILPQKYYLGSGEASKDAKLTDTFYGKLKITDNMPITYYAVGGWELAADNGFENPELFQDYVINLAEQLAVPLDVVVK